ncbi:hypothetical protein F2Q68_00044090 [Brassica cretica]|uniref:Uncharacterized protein n=1 Tax=Brassica cretica TaxID=69181 RepID=A0A8S9LQZ5_BRACR|nr:hypothetical protein F2Q68_00044090 [Brassica cretica]
MGKRKKRILSSLPLSSKFTRILAASSRVPSSIRDGVSVQASSPGSPSVTVLVLLPPGRFLLFLLLWMEILLGGLLPWMQRKSSGLRPPSHSQQLFDLPPPTPRKKLWYLK